MKSFPTVLQNESLLARSDHAAGNAVLAARTDAQLAASTLAGDESAFEHLFERHRRLVGLVASRYFRRPEQIEEIVQISFAKAFVKLAEFRGDHELSFAGWIGRIATNTCLDTLRERKRKPVSLVCELSESETELLQSFAIVDCLTPENLATQRDLAEKLLGAIRPEDRSLLHMLYVEELTVGEIAELTGWSHSKIKIRAWRARKSMRKMLEKLL